MPFYKRQEPETEDEMLQRFFAKIKEINGCWLWQGAKDWDGYGVFTVGGKSYGAHRWLYQIFHGYIQKGKVLDHFICDTRACTNPSHLKIVTVRQNTLRSKTAPAAINARKTHCVHGHPLSGENLYILVRKTGRSYRICRTCSRLRGKKSKARMRG